MVVGRGIPKRCASRFHSDGMVKFPYNSSSFKRASVNRVPSLFVFFWIWFLTLFAGIRSEKRYDSAKESKTG